MAALLSLLSALVYGVGDFCGGLATRKASPAAVVLWSHVIGLALAVATLPLVHGELRAVDVGLGAVAGAAGAAGVGLLYTALAIGPMGVVAPTTALLAAAVPVVAGVAGGDRPSGPAALGMAVALLAVVLVSAEEGGRLRPEDPRALLLALGAGAGFGTFFVVLSHAGDDAGTWPLVGARTTSVSLLVLLALTRRVSAEVPPTARWSTAVAGALDVLANLLYLFAVRQGLLSVVSVLAALYPVSTVLLARVVLGERFHRVQQVGMGLALVGTVLLAS